MAIVVRIIWAVLVPVHPISDSYAYDVFAQNIVEQGVYGWEATKPTSYWPVGTAAIYSVLFKLFGHTYWPVISFNIFCSVVVIYFSKELSDELFDDEGVGTIVAILLSLWPTLIYFTTILASELPYMAAILAAIHCFISEKAEGYKTSIICGLLFAIAYYIRPLATIPFAICIFYLIIKRDNYLETIWRSVICFTVMVILVSPWAYRNYMLYDGFVPMSTNGGATLWMGNQHGTPGGYLDIPKKYYEYDEFTRNNILKSEALQYIKDEPLQFISRTLGKFVIFHARETIGITWNSPGIEERYGTRFIMPLKVIGQLFWSGVLLFAILGLSIFVRQQGLVKAFTHPFFLLWICTAGVHAIVVAQDRYHLPVIPMVAAFAAFFILKLGRKNAWIS